MYLVQSWAFIDKKRDYKSKLKGIQTKFIKKYSLLQDIGLD